MHHKPDQTHRITRLEAIAYGAIAALAVLASALNPWGFALPL